MDRIRDEDPKFPSTLEGCIALYGAETVYLHFKQMMEIRENQRRLHKETLSRRSKNDRKV